MASYFLPMRYRYYRPDDFTALYAIEELCFEPPLRFGRRSMRQLVDSPANTTWIALEGNVMAGFGIVEPVETPRELRAYIPTLEVAPTMRRRGVGRDLLRRLERSAARINAGSIWLHVDTANAAAIRLYELQGYLLAGRAPGFYSKDHDAFLYGKPLQAGHAGT
jgi:[ribosomal protein S18]-alanine N-acetyltransferase